MFAIMLLDATIMVGMWLFYGNSSAMSKYTNFECKFICIRKIFVYFEYGVLPKARFLAAYAARKAVKQPNRACMAELLRNFQSPLI